MRGADKCFFQIQLHKGSLKTCGLIPPSAGKALTQWNSDHDPVRNPPRPCLPAPCFVTVTKQGAGRIFIEN